MYAILENGGKQYRVEEGRYIEMDLLPNQPEEKVEFDRVLLVSNNGEVKYGTPYLENHKVVGKLIRNFQGEKVTSFKYRRRKDSHVKKGHRPWYSQVMVEKIVT